MLVSTVSLGVSIKNAYIIVPLNLKESLFSTMRPFRKYFSPGNHARIILQSSEQGVCPFYREAVYLCVLVVTMDWLLSSPHGNAHLAPGLLVVLSRGKEVSVAHGGPSPSLDSDTSPVLDYTKSAQCSAFALHAPGPGFHPSTTKKEKEIENRFPQRGMLQ